jgi:ribosomal protein L2
MYPGKKGHKIKYDPVQSCPIARSRLDIQLKYIGEKKFEVLTAVGLLLGDLIFLGNNPISIGKYE